jgi:hypothetical protein
MRLKSETDGRSHSILTITENDHHSRPRAVAISNTTQSLPPGTTYNLDIDLGRSDYQLARVMIMGARTMFGVASNFRESAEVHATRNSAEAFAHSVRDSGSTYRCYAVTYSKQVGDSYLTHAIFDNNTAIGSAYILLQDAVLTGSVLRLTFLNTFGGSATLWVKGTALVW